MDPFESKTILLAGVVTFALAARAHKKKTLTPMGAATGCLVGFSITATGLRGLNLFFFYQLGSMATKFKQNLKEKQDATLATHAARNTWQVLAVSITPTLLSLWQAFACGPEQPIDFATAYFASTLSCAILAHHATCLADTLASELGILSLQSPVLITNPRRIVPPGTNGGITAMGIFWSAAGGAIIGLSSVCMDHLSGLSPLNVLSTIFFGALSGLVGSLLDSLLGALLQSSYFDDDSKRTYHSNSADLPKSAKLISGVNVLNNEQVNFFSAFITAVLSGWYIGPLVYGP